MQPFADLIAALQRFGVADLIPSALLAASPATKVLVAVFVLLVPGMLSGFALFLLARKLWRLRRARRNAATPPARPQPDDRGRPRTARSVPPGPSIDVPAAVAAAEVQMEVVRVLPVVRGR
ncbi:MAG: hypothetical protein GYA57_19340 [Myxococcales bacterium]|nr:hypothetical protein [Myxococcales bacterium]